MRVYKNEFERLKDTKAFTAKRFKQFGVNKIQELTRLLYEISKRENVAVEGVIDCHSEPAGRRISTINRSFSSLRMTRISVLQQSNYDSLKKFLVPIRYPYAVLHEKSVQPYLPKIELNSSQEISFKKTKFYPKNIYIEQSANGFFLASRIKNLFLQARILEIESLKNKAQTYRLD